MVFVNLARRCTRSCVRRPLIQRFRANLHLSTRTITLVLPFAAGSGTDTTTRIISKELGVALGVGMVDR